MAEFGPNWTLGGSIYPRNHGRPFSICTKSATDPICSATWTSPDWSMMRLCSKGWRSCRTSCVRVNRSACPTRLPARLSQRISLARRNILTNRSPAHAPRRSSAAHGKSGANAFDLRSRQDWSGPYSMPGLRSPKQSWKPPAKPCNRRDLTGRALRKSACRALRQFIRKVISQDAGSQVIIKLVPQVLDWRNVETRTG